MTSQVPAWGMTRTWQCHGARGPDASADEARDSCTFYRLPEKSKADVAGGVRAHHGPMRTCQGQSTSSAPCCCRERLPQVSRATAFPAVGIQHVTRAAWRQGGAQVGSVSFSTRSSMGANQQIRALSNHGVTITTCTRHPGGALEAAGRPLRSWPAHPSGVSGTNSARHHPPL